MRRLLAWLSGLVLLVPVTVALLGLLYAVATPPSTLMLARWLTGRDVDRRTVTLGEIAASLPAAVLAAEDARFCLHSGVDWDALRLVLDDDEDGPSRGASTIAMQVAKNLFLWPSRSYLRKALEIPLALYLDLIWSKRRMIEIYLNIAEWGDGVFGAEAAARRHFGKSAGDLNPREAALLATSLPNPALRDPAKPSRRQRALAGTVLDRVRETPLACIAKGAAGDA